MGTTRAEIIEMLCQFAGPLGPFLSMEEREAQRSAWHASLPPESLNTLLDIAGTPPPPLAIPASSRDFFEFELMGALEAVGRRNPSAFAQRITPLMSNPQARPVLIDALGGQGTPALATIKALLAIPNLTDDELIRTAGALAEIGGAEAAMLLECMRKSYGSGRPAVVEQIDNSRDIIATKRENQRGLEKTLCEAVAALHARDRESFESKAQELLTNDSSRAPFIALLGAVHSREGLAWLAPLMDPAGAPNAERIQLAAALAEAGGLEARMAVEGMIATMDPPRPELLRGLEQALKALSVGAPTQAAGVRTEGEASLEKTLAALERRERSEFQQWVVPLVSNPQARAALLAMLSAVQSSEGLGWATQAIDPATLNDSQMGTLLGMLRQLGGPEVRTALERMRASRDLSKRGETLKAIEEALTVVERSPV